MKNKSSQKPRKKAIRILCGIIVAISTFAFTILLLTKINPPAPALPTSGFTSEEITEDIPDTAAAASSSSAEPQKTKNTQAPIPPLDYVCLRIKNIMQEPILPNGCEAVSLAIVLQYNGFAADPLRLYQRFMPKSPYRTGDPWTTYVGDATSKGYGCYAPCLVNTGNAYLKAAGSSRRMVNVSGKNMDYYKRLIDGGTPVIMWGLTKMNGNPRVCWESFANGKYVNWHSYSHCLVLIGYTKNGYIFCDPLEGVVEYPAEAVEKSFRINYKQACILGQ